MTDQLPGVAIHLHEGRLSGVFDLPPADMAYISYQGRTMLVLLADAVKCNISDTKDGDTKASWVFKNVEAAVVREESMRDHLSRALYLDDEEPITLPSPRRKVLEAPEVADEEEEIRVEEEDEEIRAVDTETGEIVAPSAPIVVEHRTESEPRSGLFKPVRQPSTVAVLPQRPGPHGGDVPIAEVEQIGRPIQYSDSRLARFVEGEGEE